MQVIAIPSAVGFWTPIGIAKTVTLRAANKKKGGLDKFAADLSNGSPCSSLAEILRRLFFMCAALLTLTAFYLADVPISLLTASGIGKLMTR